MKFKVPGTNIHPKERNAYLIREESKIGGRNSIKVHKSFFTKPEIWEDEYFANNSAILEIESEELNPNVANQNFGREI